MSAFVKLSTSSGAGSYLGIPESGKGKFTRTKDSMGLQSHARIRVLSDDSFEGTEVKLNQTVKLIPITDLRPKRYTVMLSYNPRLAEFGQVSCPSIVPEGEPLQLIFKANKNVDLSELAYIFTYYMID